jgi:putative ABC transport system permease protein
MLPIIIVSIGVMLTVFLSGYIRGVMGDMIDMSARFQTGHVKVMSEAYAENQEQMPNDLALLGVAQIKSNLESKYADYEWVSRIRFGGLVDVPLPDGNTKSQGPGAGIAIDLFSSGGEEIERFNIKNSLEKGGIPTKGGEAILTDEFAKKLNVKIGDEITFFGSTMNGSMTFKNFVLTGTIKFGNLAMDRGTMIIDISDAQAMLDMDDGAGEILGFRKAGAYYDDEVKEMAAGYNAAFANDTDEFKPKMVTLGQQNNMASMIDYTDNMSAIFVAIFVFAMSIVLWNTGLLGGLRRYQEFGIRLALGESKGQIYRSLFSEAVLIGAIGSALGTGIGLFFCFLLQKHGFDISDMMPESSMLYPNVLRAKMTPDLYYVGFIPGLFSMVFGNMLAGLGIYKRETAQLFKEFEV